MSTKTARESIVTAAQAVLPDGWTVYSQPPETVAAPALVVGPRDPYIVRLTARQWDLQLRLSLMVPRSAGAIALDLIDDAIDLLRPAVLALPYVAWQTVGGLGVVTEGDVKYLLAVVDITLAHDPEA